MTMLDMQRVSKVYGDGEAEVRALTDVTLSVEPGSLVAVMGPSGSGKSTLLTIAGSLEDPTSGQVLVGGSSLASMSRNDKARLRRRSIGFVFQDFNLLPGLTAVENVSLPLELDGLSARKASAVGRNALEELGLGDRATHYPDQLSGGERQRVAIARCLVRRRPILLLDEPFAALGPAMRQEMLDLVDALRRESGLTILMVTHDPADAARIATRTAFIAAGNVIRVDETARLLASTDPAIRAYLGG
jgi:putative ABC transport system ATP-binding protein